jgi:hypothetical protein
MSLGMTVVAVIVFPWAVRVPVSSKNSETNQVRGKAQTTNNQDKLGVSNLGRVDKTREGFEHDRYAEGDEEDGVEEGT